MSETLADQLLTLRGQIHTVTEHGSSLNPPSAADLSTGILESQISRSNHGSRNSRKRMDRGTDTGFGALGASVATIQTGGNKVSIALPEEERKMFTQGLLEQQRVAIESGKIETAGRVANTALSIMGVVAMAIAIFKGVRSGSNN